MSSYIPRRMFIILHIAIRIILVESINPEGRIIRDAQPDKRDAFRKGGKEIETNQHCKKQEDLFGGPSTPC